MPAPRRLPLLVFAAWTGFVWVGRIRNVIADADVSSGSRALTTLLSAAFLLGAVAVAAVTLRPTGPAMRRGAVGGLATLTTVVWVLRGTDIALGGDHPAGFVAVHVALAVVSIVVAIWAWRAASADSRRPVGADDEADDELAATWRPRRRVAG